VWTDASIGAINFVARLDSDMFDANVNLNTENIVFGDQFGANAVGFEEDWTLSITEILTAQPKVGVGNKGFGRGWALQYISEITRNVKVVVQALDAAGTNIVTYTFYGIITTPLGIGGRRTKNTNRIDIKRAAVYDSTTGLELPNPALS
jgi:hypothetical protein